MPGVVDGRAAEPLLAADMAACRLRSGHPVRPDAATLVFAEARAGGRARPARPASPRGPPTSLETAGAVLVAAGPWTPAVVDPTGSWRPITRVWGVNVEVALGSRRARSSRRAASESAVAGDAPPLLFSLTTADGVGAPSVRPSWTASPTLTRLCRGCSSAAAPSCPRWARRYRSRVRAPPVLQRRPLLGAVPGRGRLFVAAGHGPVGISTGPASARLVADAILDPATAIPPRYDVARACAA